VKLTHGQEKAAYAKRSIAVTAGAGTGKTAMLAERFLHHVLQDRFRPIEIVAVTFTEKAAAELRQRIRKRLADSPDITEEQLAEVEAAQISTFHAMAARICRQFFNLAGIAPDFRILLDNEFEVWFSDRMDDALALVDQEVIGELGYDWLKGALRELFKDPSSSTKALEHNADHQKLILEKEKRDAIERLLASAAWNSARRFLNSVRGNPEDRVEENRVTAVNGISDFDRLRTWEALQSIVAMNFKSQGKKANWPSGEILEKTRDTLKALREEARTAAAANVEFGDDDEEASRRVALLKRAFETVSEFLWLEKQKDDVLDFTDLEIQARKILEHEAARSFYAKRWLAFLVDEFQDTNLIQGEILDLIAGNSIKTIVGDAKQSIYGFRRADITVFHQAQASIMSSGGEQVLLSETFRSHAPLVEKMNGVFSLMLGELRQDLTAKREDVPNRETPITLAVTDDESFLVEGKFIADEINRLLREKVEIFDKTIDACRPIEYRDIAILARRWVALDGYIDTLSAEGIPALNTGGGSLLDTREAKDAMALLFFLADPTDDIALVSVLRGPFFAIDDITLYNLAQEKTDESWWSLIARGGQGFENARRVLGEMLAVSKSLSPEYLLRKADELTGYSAIVANLPQGDRRAADWFGMIQLMRTMRENGLPDLLGAVRELKIVADWRNAFPRPILGAGNVVTLTTIHASKGLEWPVVIVPDLGAKTGSSGYEKLVIDPDIGVTFNPDRDDEDRNSKKPAIYELIKRRKRKKEEDEERRLLYVAITRARDQVILTSGNQKPDGKQRSGSLFQFLMPAVDREHLKIRSIETPADVRPPTPKPADPFKLPPIRHPEQIPIGIGQVSVSSMADYQTCPKKFEYRYLKGHPGLGVGVARSSTIGTLTHQALQFDISSIEALERIAEGAPREYLAEALELADRFRTHEIFSELRNAGTEKEKPVAFKFAGVDLLGTADLVGDDIVVDYKTGGTSDAEGYKLQLWAYAKALGKQRAFVAFLRDPKVYEFSKNELNGAEQEAEQVLNGIASGKFEATPSYDKCSVCAYSTICPSAIIRKSITAISQPSLF